MNSFMTRSMVIRFVGMGCLIFSASALAAGSGPWSFRAESSYISDNNVSKSQENDDIEKDTSFNGSASASYTKGLSPLTAFTFTGTAQVEEFAEFEGLSNTQVSFTTDFRFQTRSSFTAPIYSVFVRAIQADFETDIRDSSIVEFGFSATRRITDRITGTLGATVTEREADEGEVFNLDRTRYFANVDWTLSRRVAVYSTLNYIDGDVFSTATADSLDILNWAEAIEPDNAFGGVANNKFVYRLDAKTTILRLGANVGVNSNLALDFSVDILESDAVGPIEYDLTSIVASVFYRF